MNDINEMLQWLTSNGMNNSILNRLEFRKTNKGLGCYAKVNYKIGDLLFNIPRQCIIGFNNAISTDKLHNIYSSSDNDNITADLLLWMYICDQLDDSNSFYYIYLNTLSEYKEASLISWGNDSIDCLRGTNLYNKYIESRNKLTNQLELLNSIQSNQLYPNSNKRLKSFNYSFDDLLWAKSIYLSRRYPGKFAYPYDSTVDYRRESDLGNLGALVPLLDILNHDDTKDWLTFDITDTHLNVICNHPVNIGEELLSNYGQLSNEILLYAYGFALPDNIYDTITLQLMCKSTIDDNVINLGTYFLSKSTITSIPKELWKSLSYGLYDNEDDSNSDDSHDEEIGLEECEILSIHLNKKLQSILLFDESAAAIIDININNDNKYLYIKYYRDNQRRILSNLVNELNLLLEES